VELEISLDETREQYNNVLRTSNNRAQQKKMAFLERNLEQLTHVQRQLMEQNGSLKKEVAIAERKLVARNERIGSLEALLGDSQEKLTAANSRYMLIEIPCFATTDISLQIRSPAPHRQRPPRGRQTSIDSRTRRTNRTQRLQLWRCWITHSKAAARRRCYGCQRWWSQSACPLESPGAGSRWQ
jgi:hypothetical protein